MHRSSYLPYSDEYLDSLMERVLEAYVRNRNGTKREKGIEHINVYKIPNSSHNSYYTCFSADILKSTGTKLSEGSIFKLLSRKLEKRNNEKEETKAKRNIFELSTIDTFEQYVDTIQTSKGLVRVDAHNITLKGARLIDSDFRSKMQSVELVNAKMNFYLSKNENDCQWYGIFRTWDHPREIQESVQEQLLFSFNWESRVTALITGVGGSGKSTFLRRLAADNISRDFKILWVKDLKDFCDDDLNVIGNTPTKYLVFIDNWTAVENNGPLTSTFMTRVSNINNIRLIIGDRNASEQKPYYKYILGNNKGTINIFQLSTKENLDIIQKALIYNDGWQNAANKVLSNSEFYNNAPIFVVLFVLARCSDGIDFANTKEVISVYKEIILSDLKNLNEMHPGLARMLYYWSHMCYEHSGKTDITWNAFLTLANSYSPDLKRSKYLLKINQAQPIGAILSRYISLEPLVNPELPENTQILHFHHDLIAEEFLAPIDKTWYFNQHIKLEMFDTLLEKKEIHSADVIYNNISFGSDDSEFSKHEKDRLWRYFSKSFFSNERSLQSIIQTNLELKKIYSEAGVIVDEAYWRSKVLSPLLRHLSRSIYTEEHIKKILQILIYKGCKARCIIKAYNILEKSKDRILKEMDPAVLAMKSWHDD